MRALATADRYWRTLRHLRPVQFYGRAWFRLAGPRPVLDAAPPLRTPRGDWRPPARRTPSLVGPGVFRLLNETGDLDRTGWNDPARAYLWRYNQHYFDDLNAQDAEARRDWHLALIADWLVRNPPGQGCGWEPYPVSLRIVNWVKWALGGAPLPPEAVHSLAVQARWLRSRMEWHLLGNHLFANAKALVFAGLFFDGEEAGRWLRTGLSILSRELDEQILADGGHFELSPMYHALALEDVLDLLNLAACFEGALPTEHRDLPGRLRVAATPMLRWLHAMSHPDGGVAFFNDTALGVAPGNAELDAYAARLVVDGPATAESVVWLCDSGYARLAESGAVLLADLARVGPDYLPGHAHADTLSFELSLHGRRLFVNSGVSLYGDGPERLRQRGTAAHNTVVVDGRNSSDVWSGFRVGRRARPSGVSVGRDGEALIAEGAHDGYGPRVHRRRWRLVPGRLRIEDSLSSDAPAEARFHLHPDAVIEPSGPDGGSILLPDRRMSWRTEGGAARIEPSTWHPEFGVSLAAACLVLPLADGRAALDLDWT